MVSLRSLSKRLAEFLLSTLHAGLILGIALGPHGYAATAAAANEPAPPAATSSAEPDFEELVGPVALYPDELLGIVLPASTFPLQIVQASRYLDQKKTEPDLEPSEEWDESVIGLLNYPEVIELMNDDLDWTWALGEAVADHQPNVMESVQTFRKKAKDAGNLTTNEKMKVSDEEVEDEATQEKETVVVIESTSTEVIYVPQYQPSTVVVVSATPYPWYYSPPYPYYYHPAAAFWTGMFVGAAVGYGMRWGYHGHGDININRNVNINANRNTNISNRQANLQGGGGNSWKADRGKGTQAGGRPGNKNVGSRPSTGATHKGTRPSAGSGSRPSAGTRPSTGQAGATRDRASTQGSRTRQPDANSSSRSKSRDMTSPSRSQRSTSHSGRSSVGRYESGGAARSHSSRGHSSRGGMSHGGGGGSRGGGGMSRGGGGGRRR